MSKEIGTLVVVILKARNLRDKHTIHKQDVYAQATINKTTKKTKVEIRGGQHPVWDEELRFPIYKAVSDESRKLEVACYSKEPRTDDHIGSGSVDITETLKTGEFDGEYYPIQRIFLTAHHPYRVRVDWVPLKTEDGGYRGDLFLEMTFYSAAPPLQRRPSKWAPADRLQRPTSTYPHGPTVPPDTGTNGHATPIPRLQKDALPPLPEEPASPPFVPASLRPGAASSAKTSPKAGGSLLPPEHPVHTQAPCRDASPPAPSRQRVDSIPIPVHLRPGGGAVPPMNTNSHRSSTGSGSLPGGPQIPGPQIPEPQIPTPERPTYGVNAAHVGPLPYGAPVPLGIGVGPSEPVRQPFGEYGSPPRRPAYGEYGSQPRGDYEYASPSIYPPQSQVHASPPQPPQLYPPYGGGYPSHYPPPPQPPPTQRDFDLPDPYLQKRYQTPLPLPEEARAGRTPTPSHPFGTPQPQPQQQPQAQPRLQSSTQPPAPLKVDPPRKVEQPKAPSRAERDRAITLAFEKEEEERRRNLREQEERDMELARQLDLELNLENEGGGGGSSGNAASER